MSAPIGPGDWVERVPCGPGTATPVASVGEVPRVGKIYQVREVGRGVMVGGGDGLRLVGVKLTSPDYPGRPDLWAQVEAFRPVYRPRADLIEQLKQPAPDIERVTEDA